ncbi:MAG: hypothetical protein AAF231_05300 [Pseudomonadota bacterium]
MNAAERAFKAAEAAIQHAESEGSTELYLTTDKFNALECLPESISRLKNLHALHLDNTKIREAKPLAKLRRLSELSLYNTRINDIAPLARLKSLVWLVLSGTQIVDVKPLSKLKALKELYLNGTSIVDATPLEVLKDLRALGLKNTRISDVTPIRSLTALTRLNLNSAQISDVTSLSALKNLKGLDLSNTKVFDLRPLRELSLLIENPDASGLAFENSAAALIEPRIAEIASIEDNLIRARTLFDYLDTWEPPTPDGDAPPPDIVFPMEVVDDRLEVAASYPTFAEQEEALKRSMHGDLKDLVERLAQAAGNQFPRLAEAARRMEGLLGCPFEELDMPRVYVGLRPILNAVKAAAEDGVAFTDQVADLLDQAELSGLGLTRDNPDVEVLIKRAGRQREHPDPEEDRAAQDTMSRAVASNMDAIGDQLRGLQTQLAELDDPEAVEAKKAVNRNILWRIGVGVLTRTETVVVGVGTGVITTAYGPEILNFVTTNAPLLKDAALTYGREFAEWFGKAISRLLTQ